MKRYFSTFLILLTMPLLLQACGNSREQPIEVADNYDLGRQNALHISKHQRSALASLFNSGVPIKSVRWPSNSVIGFYANQDLWKGIGAPLPVKYATKYGADEDLKRAAWNVYRMSVVRGLDNSLIDQYFNSRLGRREIRGTYLMVLAYTCYKAEDKIPASIKNEALQIFTTGGPIKFTCPKNPSLRPHPVR